MNAREDDGTTGAGLGGVRSNIGIAELLLKAGANPNLTNELGIGPLSLAIANGSRRWSAAVAENGADPNVARENGETPLDDGRAHGPDRSR